MVASTKPEPSPDDDDEWSTSVSSGVAGAPAEAPPGVAGDAAPEEERALHADGAAVAAATAAGSIVGGGSGHNADQTAGSGGSSGGPAAQPPSENSSSGTGDEQQQQRRRRRRQYRHSNGSDTLLRDRSAPSSLYGGRSASLVGGAGGSIAAATVASTVNCGTLSPQYTLVNSDGASLRVHTGSIRERYMQQHISAIHEDDSDVYSESRRSDSLLFAYEVQSTSSRYYAGQPGSGRTLAASNPPSAGRPPPDDTSVTAAAAAVAAATSAVATAAAAAAAAGVESDSMSVFSRLSEGGASTTRMRMATDRAYNALRIGPPAAAGATSMLSYYSGTGGGGGGGPGLHRVTSFATSSDPGGLPSAGSFYDMYYVDADARARAAVGDSPRFSEAPSDSRSGRSYWRDDFASAVRSDVAIYSGAGEDVKFPFLHDNISEFSGPYICTSAGHLDAAERLSLDYSDIVYYRDHTPMPDPPPELLLPPPPPPPPHRGVFGQRTAAAGAANAATADAGKKVKRKKKKDKEPRLLPRHSRGKQRAGSSAAEYATAPPNAASAPLEPSGAMPHGMRHWMMPLATVGPSASTANPWGRSAHRYRHQSAGESAYPSAAVAAAVAAAAAAAAAASSSSAPVADPKPPLAADPADHAAIRPNAIMRFLKRIAPKN
ncbi:hypothetical protein IWQ56_000085 [Coemansia nantahalensis]|nr:hypothetical protein IWQ56_000085 [Coemansia nantahalensis]